MSRKSIYLRDQAAKCRSHADLLTDVYTQGELRRLAVQYVERAAEIEGREVDLKRPEIG